MTRLRRYLPLLTALLAAACGSTSHSSAAAAGLPSDPTRAVRQALAALSNRPFNENFTQVARAHVTGVAPAKAAQFNARLRGVRTTETGVAQFKDVHNFQEKITTSDSGTEYTKAAGGSFLVSSDGVHYRPAPAGEQQSFNSQTQVGLPFLSRGVTQVKDVGPRTVNGVAVEEYTGVFPGSAIRAAYGSTVTLPAGSALGRSMMTIDVSRAADVPVRMVDVVSLSTDLAALQSDLRGRMITVVTSTRAFTHFGPAR